MSLRFVLPYPPSTNRLYRAVGGRQILSAEAREYMARVSKIVRIELLLHYPGPPQGPLELSVWLYPPDARRRDVDGPIKRLQDALFKGLGIDDVAVQTLHVYRMEPDRENPRTEVTLTQQLMGINSTLEAS